MTAPTSVQLATLHDPAVRQLAGHGMVRGFRKNAIVITEGESGDSLYVILSGRVRIFLTNDDGREMTLDTRGPGDLVGEMALDGGMRSASVMCVEPCVFSIVTRSSLRDAIAADPDFALQVIATLIGRVRQATDLVKNLGLLDVYGRVAGLLLKLATEQDGRLVVTEKLTQQEIAERVGASRDMVNRIFGELTAGGYISIERRQIVINRKPPAHR
jgi:CRP/FNR family transcriptional regulator, cyclic AMP receptor protein